MRIVVFAKAVPDVAEAELELYDGEVDVEDLVFGVNEWDAHAVEAAIRLKEAHGGHVTVASLGGDAAEDVVRRALAMGADDGVLVDGEDFDGSDSAGVARGLARVARHVEGFDLLLCGAQSADTGWGAVGPAVAELLDLPFAALAVSVEALDGRVRVHRELEANAQEVVELQLPALVTVQTGTDQPRYVSVLGIRKARRLRMHELDIDDLALDADEVGHKASSVVSAERRLPEAGGGAEMLQGSLDEVCRRTASLMKGALG